MARLNQLSAAEYGSDLLQFMDRQGLAVQDASVIMSIWAQAPQLAMAYGQFSRAVMENSTLPRRLIELVRLRIAFHNQCRSCMSVRYQTAVEEGLTEDLVCELAAPEEAENLTSAERVALKYADLMATNHLAIDDALFAELKAVMSEPQIVELGNHVAIFIGFGRMAMAWDCVDTLPERFRKRGETITPWGGGAKIVPERFGRQVDPAHRASEGRSAIGGAVATDGSVSFLVVKAKVPESSRALFDRWYADEHLPQGAAFLEAARAWRFWRDGFHYAIYQCRTERLNDWNDLVARRVASPLREEFDRTWPDVTREYEILVCVDHLDRTGAGAATANLNGAAASFPLSAVTKS